MEQSSFEVAARIRTAAVNFGINPENLDPPWITMRGGAILPYPGSIAENLRGPSVSIFEGEPDLVLDEFIRAMLRNHDRNGRQMLGSERVETPEGVYLGVRFQDEIVMVAGPVPADHPFLPQLSSALT